jgi:hypothetical protein
MSQSRSTEQDVASQTLLDELAQLTQDELLEMERLLHDAEADSLFGANEFKIRDLALKLAAKLYQRRLAQKKTATTAPA